MKRKFAAISLGGVLLSAAIGVALSLILTRSALPSPYPIGVGAAYATVLGLFAVILTVEIVSVFKIRDSTVHTVLIAACLFAQYLFSVDAMIFFTALGQSIPLFAFGIPSEIAYVLNEICCCRYILFLCDVKTNRGFLGVIPPVCAALMAYSVLLIYGYGYIAHFTIVAVYAVWMFYLLRAAEARKRPTLTACLTSALFCLSAGAQSVNVLFYDGISAPITGLTLAYALVTVALFFTVYLFFAIKSDVKAERSDTYKTQAQTFRTMALSGQIKPHFIFNSLEAVRALYHRDLRSGDEAIGLLSDFLRGSINSFDNELVPFETELDNVFNYTEFENLKRSHKIEVIFDTDFTDFKVPPFSIQPFVENAMKYSGVENKEDGRIVVSSYQRENKAVVEVSDNGKGFDQTAVQESSHGIRNACERFEVLLACSPKIVSVAGSGTCVTIEIPLNVSKEKKK